MTEKSKPVPKLFEYSAHIRYHAVVCATSKEDADAEIDAWCEECWQSRSDAGEVNNVDLADVRDLSELSAEIAEDDAHVVTEDAARYLQNDEPGEA